MIADWETNTLFVADTLAVKHPEFFVKLEAMLGVGGIPLNIIPGTKDIWCRDYMPVQLDDERFVSFKYDPDYLQEKKWKNAISPVVKIYDQLGLNLGSSDLVVDGGNIVKSKGKAIVTDKIFRENPTLTRSQVIEKLLDALEIEQVILLPTHPEDFIGHADGMVRFINEDAILLNDYSKEKEFQKAVIEPLQSAGLDIVPMTYSPYQNKNFLQAQGIYTNYLHLNSQIVFPVYGREDDERALKIMEAIFSEVQISTLDCNSIADKGGVLNCITWNIYQKP